MNSEFRQGLAPHPDQLERMRQVRIAAQAEIEESGGSVPQFGVRDETFSDGIDENTTLDLQHEIKQLVYGLHWQYQKQVLDIVQAAIGHNEKQWPVVRKLIMDVSTAQIQNQTRLIGQRFRQEMLKEGMAGARFERPDPSN